MELRRIGRYTLEEEIGRGPNGAVYRAQESAEGRPAASGLALKLMPLEEAGTGLTREELAAWRQIEVRVTGLLLHPNILPIRDTGVEGGSFYIVTDLVEGPSLQRLLEQKTRLPVPAALLLAAQVCAALDYAHARNIVHRNLKPSNILLAASGTAKVTDFSMAKLLQLGRAPVGRAAVVTPYTAPEQCQGKLVDGRADLFALGVILYELLSGRSPFRGDDPAALARSILQDAPPLLDELDAAIPPGLSRAIAKALAKEPESRFPGCAEFAEALCSQVQAAQPAPAPVAVAAGEPGPGAPAPMARAQAAGTSRDSAARVPPLPGRDTRSERGAPLTPLVPPPEPQAKPQKRPPLFDVETPAPAVPLFASHAPAPSRVSWWVLAALLALLALAGYWLWAEWYSPAARPDDPPGAAEEAGLPASPPEAGSTQSPPGEPPAEPGSAAPAEAGPEGSAPAGGATPEPARAVAGSPEQLAASGIPRAATPAELEIASDVLGAQAVLIGPQGQTRECRTPCRFEGLAAGRYGLEVAQAGYRPERRILHLSAGEKLHRQIYLEPLRAGLYVSSEPAGAEVYLNGEKQPGITPTMLTLPPGSYTIRLQKPGYIPYEASYDLRAEAILRVSAVLAPGPPPGN